VDDGENISVEYVYIAVGRLCHDWWGSDSRNNIAFSRSMVILTSPCEANAQ
jgi:hypothetical protein